MANADQVKPVQLVELINADMETIRSEGIDMWGVGIGAGGSVVVYITEEDEGWMQTLRSRYGEDVQFFAGPMPGAFSKSADD